MDPNNFISLPSPAKINLSLRIGNRLPNGYHQIVSMMAPITLCDEVKLRVTDQPQSSCRMILAAELADAKSLAALNSVEENIAARAAKAVLGEKCFELVIEKNIPAEAGLGGGSGDAATALLLANQLREAPLAKTELLRIANTLGSDVGPMLFREPVVQSGDSVERADLPKEVLGMELLLVKPPFGTATKEAYQRLNRPEVDPSNPDFRPTFSVENDFEEVFFLENWFQEGSKVLLEFDAERILLCGSGSAIAGFFHPGSISNKTVLEAKNRLNNWWVYQTRFWS